MARAYRCAAQPATRLWLDCYYGAAQPVRAALGMPPAPQAQLSDVQPMAGQPADIAVRDQVMGEAAHCAALAEDRRWLDCFYAAANPARIVLGLNPLAGGPDGARNVPPPSQRSGGFLSSIFGATEIQVRARMASYSFDGNKNFVVTLENGQVWRQLEGDSSVAHWRKPAGTYLVTITGGALGSHNLSVKDIPGRFKVRRVSPNPT